MLIDAFMALDEEELVKLRCLYLEDIVDLTIIGESNVSHSGKAKELHFHKLRELNQLPKNVLVLALDLSSKQTAWEREIRSRELIVDYIYTNFPDTFFILSDVDEIPSLNQVRFSLEMKENFHFVTPTVYRKANWALVDSHRYWSRGVMGHTSKPLPPNGGRFSPMPVIDLEENGIHLSYVRTNSSKIVSKLESFAHTELDIDYLKSKELLDFSDNFLVDHLGRFDNPGFGLLKSIQQSELSTIQNRLLELNEKLFDFRKIKHKLPARIFASMVITFLIKFRPLRRTTFNLFIFHSVRFRALKKTLFSVLIVSACSLLLLKRQISKLKLFLRDLMK